MKQLLQGKRGGALVFGLITALVVGGLAWVTAAAMGIEEQQNEDRAVAELRGKLRLALWRLDSRVFPVLAKEVSRPYHHYCAISPPTVALGNDGQPLTAGTVLEPSPLLSEALPEWILLHFQISTRDGAAETRAFSPQVLSAALRKRLEVSSSPAALNNVTPERETLLGILRRHLSPKMVIAEIERQQEKLPAVHGAGSMSESLAMIPGNTLSNRVYDNTYSQNAQGGNPAQPPPQTANDSDFQLRQGQKAQQMTQAPNMPQWIEPDGAFVKGLLGNGEQWLGEPGNRKGKGRLVSVACSTMVPYWTTLGGKDDELIVARLVSVDEQPVLCQGLLLDWRKLGKILVDEVRDLFPEAQLRPAREESATAPETTMSALPLQLVAAPIIDGNKSVAAPLGWTPLRFGLALTWLAALIALAAVGLGGWSLLELADRRMRFVSAVTHELRTPLTTLRLYLDMLNTGMVPDEARRTEYFQTLHAEAERLHKLVANVLDFARLENHRTRPEKTATPLADFLSQLRDAWELRCREAGKDLIIQNQAPAGAVLCTDPALLQQVIGNLIENACKYSRSAKDPSLWVRVRAGDGRRLIVDVEDRGPGVAAADRRAIFRPFLRGQSADVTTAGVGLGLALAERWTRLLGGRLSLVSVAPNAGACFRIELAALQASPTSSPRLAP